MWKSSYLAKLGCILFIWFSKLIKAYSDLYWLNKQNIEWRVFVLAQLQLFVSGSGFVSILSPIINEEFAKTNTSSLVFKIIVSIMTFLLTIVVLDIDQVFFSYFFFIFLNHSSINLGCKNDINFTITRWVINFIMSIVVLFRRLNLAKLSY